MFSFFINAQLNYDNRQWPQEQPMTLFYPNFIPVQVPQLQPSLYFGPNYHVKEQKPLPDTQQDDVNEIQVKNIKVQVMSEQIPQSISQKKIKVVKKKKTKSQKKKKDRIYYPNSQINVSEIAQERFLQKNIQYNLLNQIFSFVWNERKSRCTLVKYFKGSHEKTTIFYEYFRILKRGIKRILHIQMLSKLCNFKQSHPGFKTISNKKSLISVLSLEQFSSGVRFLVNIYLKHFCHLSVLTSKKMRQNIWVKHLIQARKLRQYLFETRVERNSQISEEMMEMQDQNNSQS